MSNVQSYNALIDRFKAFASGHFILKSFSHGQIDTADLEKFTQYPFMHVVPSNVTYAQGTKTFSFQIVLADLPRDKEDKVEFQREVLSDLQRIAEDLVAEITNHRVLFGDLITVQNVTLEPFLEEFHNTLTGWTVSLDLLVPYYWDACSIPAEWNDMFESGSGGTGSILTFVDSITRDENGNVSLVNDEAEPAPNYYYGTNEEGVRGWYLLTDEVGLTCATIGTCQTIIDIESAIDDLQEEIALKANTADLGAVAFSNDYNDLDNLPNLSGYGDMFKSVYDTDVDGVVDSAERIQIVVRNSTGSTLTKGQIVYLSGATGNRPNAVLAQANTEATSSKTIGMVIEDIPNNTDGQIAVNGTLHDIDTSAFTAGDTLWLSATTAGGMVANTPPAEPNHSVFIGYVARSHPSLGRVVLAIQNGYELDELHGVQITTPANNEVLTYESSSGLWKNKTANAGTVTSVAVTAGTGISVTGSPITSSGTITVTNSAPDQVVALTAGTNIGVTGTYPNFTISNTQSLAGYVPTTRTLTINGTTQDLSADRTFTIATGLTVGATPITSGTVGRVLFEGTGNVLQQSANLFWDNTNSRLGIGTASPSFGLDVNGTARISGQLTTGGRVAINGTTLIANAAMQINGTNQFVNYNASYLSGSFYTYQAFGAWEAIGADSAAGTILAFGGYRASQWTGITFHSSGVERLRIVSNGNVLIGTTTDAGFKLDVNGNTRITGSGATSATNGLTVLNSALEEFLVVRNDGLVYSRGYNFWFSRQTATSAVANGSFLTGYRSSATGSYSFAANGGMEGIGGSSSATGNMSAVFGRNTSAYLTGQFAHSSYGFSQGASQHSFVQLIRDIVGVSISELFINGTTLRATLPVANSIWVAKIYVNAVCNTAGGTTVLGAVFSGEYFVTVKRIGSTTSIVGTVTANEKADASMTTSVVLIDADDTNDSLRIQFTPPITAGATTAIRVMANLHLTELRY